MNGGRRMVDGRWEHFPHGADLGVRGFGPTREAAFEQAALALVAAAADLGEIEPQAEIEIRCTGPDDELLLVNWLNAVLYEMATRHMVFGRFELKRDGDGLAARAWGERLDRSRHRLGTEVKGATMTGLKVRRDPSGEWTAETVVDV
jgi:tRNA nucleotidyltransferase (CCA-adding enzyme)